MIPAQGGGSLNEAVPRGREAGQEEKVTSVTETCRSHGRGRWVALGLVVAMAAGAVWAWRAGVFSPVSSGSGQQEAPAPATRPVTRQDISATTPVTATLGYAASYPVTGQGSGTLTWVPSAGAVIRQGQVLYKTDNGTPVALLYGSVPAWRDLSEGLTGQDVSQLNHDLVALGDADRADIVAEGWDYYSWETAVGVENLETHLGVSSPSGNLTLGQVVFKPEALRVSQVTGSLGGQASGPVLSATSDRHVVTINLDASQQSQVKAGDAVSVTLPDGATTPGVIPRSARWRPPRPGRAEPAHHDRGAGGARSPGRGGNPRPGAGDGEHHHLDREGRAGGAGGRAAGPVLGRVRRRGGRDREHPPPGAGERGAHGRR